jgi:hypothetical protein
MISQITSETEEKKMFIKDIKGNSEEEVRGDRENGEGWEREQ